MYVLVVQRLDLPNLRVADGLARIVLLRETTEGLEGLS